MAVCSYCGELCEPAHHECGGVLPVEPAPAFFNEPVYLWEIEVGGQRGIVCRMETKAPNKFQRWMYKALLGWQVNLL